MKHTECSKAQRVSVYFALCFVFTLEKPRRFADSRSVPAYFGLVPARSQSGGADPQLRQWGLGLAGQSGPRAKRRAAGASPRWWAANLRP